MQAQTLDDGGESLVAGAAGAEQSVDVIGGLEDEGQGDNVQSLVKAGHDQVGVRAHIGGAVDNSLDTLLLVAGGELVLRIDGDGDLAVGAVAQILAKLTAHIGPAGVIRSGAGEGPLHRLVYCHNIIGKGGGAKRDNKGQCENDC